MTLPPRHLGERMQHCFNCGEEVGIFRAYSGDIIACGKPECLREERDAYRAREEEAQERAREDGYERYM